MTDEKMRLLEQEIQSLPQGGLTNKTMHGYTYTYYQWSENGKQHSRRVKDDELEALRAQIERRKELEAELKALRQPGAGAIQNANPKSTDTTPAFHTDVITGAALLTQASTTRGWKKRACFTHLQDFLYGNYTDRVFILYGLRRTGKTTLLRQAVLDMPEDMQRQSAYLMMSAGNTLADVNRDLRTLYDQGYRYIFLDEVTLLEDFIEGAALFSDIYASLGMKIVLSGTDSLGFLFSEDEQLYDRCIFLHTTFIPYPEFEQVLGVKGIDQYIRYGGTMSVGGTNYNDRKWTFANSKTAEEYVDSAIARNIQHSLKNYQYEGHFRSLRELYEEDELTSAINRVVEDMNHAFTLRVLTQDFKSHDLGVSANTLRSDRSNPTNVLDNIDLPAVTERLKNLLEIKNRTEQTVDITETHRVEIQEYLEMLDLTVDIDTISLSGGSYQTTRTVFSQPGLRYAQADALIASLLGDPTFLDLSLTDKRYVTERIRSEIKGRMMEEIVLLETKMARPDCSVFKLQFAAGEFDMVVFDPEAGCCEIYEIKHSEEQVPAQYRHLVDTEKCAQTEFHYGPIQSKTVIYRGPSDETPNEDSVVYQNVEEYLKNL